MRVGVDAVCWANRRGYGRFTRSILKAVIELDHSNEYVFFVDQEDEALPLPSGVNLIRVSTSKPAVKAAGAHGRRSWADLNLMRRAIHGQDLDLIFFPSVYSYIPMLAGIPQLVTIHDVIPELYPELVFPTLRSRLFWSAKVKLGCLRARLILTVSSYASNCLATHMRLAPAKLRVINEASDSIFRRLDQCDPTEFWNKLGVAPIPRFIAYVGGFSPHKNLDLLVEVFQKLSANPEFADVHLLLSGDYTSDVFYSCYSRLRDQVRRAGLHDSVIFTGYLSDEDLVTLLNLAELLVLPSVCEGFGLPAVEAAACGAPVVVTTESPLPALLGEGAIGVSPNDASAWCEAIACVLRNPRLRKQMGEAALAAASRLSWKNSARDLLSIFEEVGSSYGATA